jgi:hypothetical protein
MEFVQRPALSTVSVSSNFGPSGMSFHDSTFRLLGGSLCVSPAAQKQLDESELRLGITLPTSVREWYERESAIRVLVENSNDDPPIDVSKFELASWQSKTLMPIRRENQGVCTWAVEIDGTEDPAVFVAVDNNGMHWNLVADKFSDYVYSCVWDYQVVLKQIGLVQAQNCRLTKIARNLLLEALTPVLTTHGWPGSTQFRFSNPRFGVLIWDSEGQADWFVGACDAESLRVGLDAVWDFDSVGDSFYDCSDIGRDVLAEIRRRPNKPVQPNGTPSADL